MIDLLKANPSGSMDADALRDFFRYNINARLSVEEVTALINEKPKPLAVYFYGQSNHADLGRI